jgi:putative ABC transport system permease protein
VKVTSALLRIASRSATRNWRHSLGSVLAVAVGFAAITLFDGYLADFEARLREVIEERFMMGTLVVEGTGTSEAMSRRRDAMVYLREPEQAFLEEYLRSHAPEVAARVRSLFVGGIVSNGRASTPFIGWGYDPEEGAVLRGRFAWDAWNGRPLQQSGEGSVLLARGLAGLLECAATTAEPPYGPDGLPIARARPFGCRRHRLQLIGSTAAGQVNAVEADVAGIMDGGRKEVDVLMISMPLGLAQRFRNTRDVTQYNVLLRNPATAERFARELAAAATSRGFAIDAMPWQASYFGEQYRQGIGLIRALRGLMSVVVVLIAGTAVFSTMAKSVTERTREIGTLRSLGFVRRQITGLFALEAALLSAAACAAGLFLTLAVTVLVNGAGITYSGGILSNPLPLGVAVDPGDYLRVAAFLVAISVLAAWLPARRAAHKKIPDALAWA